MPINESWSKWIKLSVDKHIKTELNNRIKIWVQGDESSVLENLIIAEQKWVELRINGPDIYLLQGETRLDLIVSIMCGIKNSSSVADPNKFSGICQSTLTHTIEIYKLGNEAADDKSFLGCMQFNPDIQPPVMTTNWGIMNPIDQINYVGIEGFYRLTIDN